MVREAFEPRFFRDKYSLKALTQYPNNYYWSAMAVEPLETALGLQAFQ